MAVTPIFCNQTGERYVRFFYKGTAGARIHLFINATNSSTNNRSTLDWEVVVPSGELPALRQDHLVSSTAHRNDGVHARVVADAAPRPDARALEPSLEDAYLATLAAHRHRAAAEAAV